MSQEIYHLFNRTPHDIVFKNGSRLPKEDLEELPPLRATRTDRQLGEISLRQSRRRPEVSIPVYEVDLGELEDSDQLQEHIDQLQEKQRRLGLRSIIVASRWAVRAAELSGFSPDPEDGVGLGFPVRMERDKKSGAVLHAEGVGVPQSAPYAIVDPKKIQSHRSERFFDNITQLSLRTPEATWQLGRSLPLRRKKNDVAEPNFEHTEIGTDPTRVSIYRSYPRHVEGQRPIDNDTLEIDHSEAIIAEMLTAPLDERRIDQFARKAFVWKPDRLPNGQQSHTGRGIGFFSPQTWERIRKLGY